MGSENGKSFLWRLRLLVPTVWRLGLLNVATVALYRAAVRTGLVEKCLPPGERYDEPLFQTPADRSENPAEVPKGNAVVAAAEDLLEGKATYFSYHKLDVGTPPDWFQNPFNGKRLGGPLRHWSAIGDFDPGIGDIKIIWELSRFDWALVFARAFRQSGDLRFLKCLNNWCTDWIANNPLNLGPNWKCGQETGIRMLQILLTAFLLRQHQHPTEALIRFVFEHCGRIEPTIRYALAQDNNHGTSEASALFIGGAWLEKYSPDARIRREGNRWKHKGRKWLEDRVGKLVEKDGSFSQYSITYHRVLVDTLNIVEFWRKTLGLKEFSRRFQGRCRAAVNWLYQMVDEKSGDAPNLGANDGARLFVLSDTDYRDFRPSVQMGAVLFMGGKVYPAGPWDEPLSWLGIEGSGLSGTSFARKTMQFPQGGYVTIKDGNGAWGLMRYPRFRFRPAHADVFHFDLWHQGQNILRDSGSYSYNTEEPWQSYFLSAKAHNTIEFNGNDQMPFISRFLRGCWLKLAGMEQLTTDNEFVHWAGTYEDYRKNKHKRTVKNVDGIWKITDVIEGYDSSAILRWRLLPATWNVTEKKCISKFAEINITCNVPIKRMELVEGWESRYYFSRSPIPVLEVEIAENDAVIISEFQLNQSKEEASQAR